MADIVKRDPTLFKARSDAPANSEKKPTSREVEVIRLLSEEKANKEVADVLGTSVRTAELHRSNVMKKFGFRSFAELVRYALRTGIATSSRRDSNTAQA